MLKIIIDGDILINYLNKGSGRSGIFWTSYNIINELSKRKDIQFDFWCEREKQAPFFQVLRLTNWPGKVYPRYQRESSLIRRSKFISLGNSYEINNENQLEPWGIWTGHVMKVHIRISPKVILKSLRVKIDISSWFAGVSYIKILNEKNKICYYQNDVCLPEILFDIPIVHLDGDRSIFLEIQAKGASSPKSHKMSTDSRILGVGIKNISILVNEHSPKIPWNFFEIDGFFNARRRQGLPKWKSILFGFFINFLQRLYQIYYKQGLKQFDSWLSLYRKIPTIVPNNLKRYTILYDTIPLLDLLKDYRAGDGWFSDLFKSLNYQDNYFVISEAAKQDFLHYNPKLNPKHMQVCPLACDSKFKPTPISLQIKQKYSIPITKKYIFSLCTLEPRKNLLRAVKTFIEFIAKNHIENLVFVLGGASWPGFVDILSKECNIFGKYKDRIIYAGYVDDEDLPALYSNAEWFVYTSQYEGFGLPPLEAMSCGTPVITSNNSSLPEVVGNAGLMIDWDSDEQHIMAYKTYYFNHKLRKQYAKRGLQRSKKFSWSQTVDQIVENMKQGKLV